jgi:hypothetical protein
MWLISEAQLALQHNSIKATEGGGKKEEDNFCGSISKKWEIAADLKGIGNRCGSQRNGKSHEGNRCGSQRNGSKSLRISK